MSFSLNEFTRLTALLTNDPDLREALLDSSLERTRQPLDARICHDAFWDTTAAPVFNNPQSKPSVDFKGIVEIVDSSLQPLHPLSGAQQRKKYLSVRGQFTFAHNNRKI